MPYIHYPIRFQEEQIKSLLNSGSKINTTNLDFAWKLSLKVWKTNVRAQKINGFVLETFKMVITNFQIEDTINRPRFFQKIFLVANTKFKVILKMFFLKLSNANVLFSKKTLTWRIYTINKALSIIKQIQIINKKDFVIVALNADSKMFVVHMVIQE